MARTKTVKEEKKKVNTKKEEKEVINVDKIKEELTDYVNKEIKKGFNEQVEKVNKKLIREKNKKILFRNIIILILIALVGFLLYLLYDINYFDQFFKSSTNTTEVVEKKEVKQEKTEEELKVEYSSLLDKIKLSENSSYLKDYYKGNLTNELKNYLALNLIDFISLEKEDNYNIITAEELANSYSKIFSDNYTSISFNYNGNKVLYLSKLNSYITDSILEKDSTSINREIISIKEDNGEVIIITKEKLLKDNKTYNMKYTFKEGKLISLES